LQLVGELTALVHRLLGSTALSQKFLAVTNRISHQRGHETLLVPAAGNGAGLHAVEIGLYRIDIVVFASSKKWGLSGSHQTAMSIVSDNSMFAMHVRASISAENDQRSGVQSSLQTGLLGVCRE
jgi:hypothetical protein